MKTDRSNSKANGGSETMGKDRLLSLRHHAFSLRQTVLGFNMISEIASAYSS